MSKYYRNLNPIINKNQLRCLNEDSHYPVQNIFQKEGHLQSLDDEQLLIHIPFNETVTLWSINIISNPIEYSRPVLINLFINKPNMTFQDVESYIPVQEIELLPEELEPERKCLLKFTSFQRVNHLTIFVEDNDGSEVTIIENIIIYGKPLKGMNMKDLKKCGG